MSYHTKQHLIAATCVLHLISCALDGPDPRASELEKRFECGGNYSPGKCVEHDFSVVAHTLRGSGDAMKFESITIFAVTVRMWATDLKPESGFSLAAQLSAEGLCKEQLVAARKQLDKLVTEGVIASFSDPYCHNALQYEIREQKALCTNQETVQPPEDGYFYSAP